MKLKNKIILAGLGLTALTGAVSCEDQLEVVNPNLQTTESFGKTASDLEEVVIACYNHIRMEGTYARVGYFFDVIGGDELNSYSDNDWWRGHDYLNVTPTADLTSWVLRDYSFAVNACNEVLYGLEQSGLDPESDKYKQIKGQALFIRGHCYYELGCYYGTCPMITDYSVYGDLDKMYVSNSS
ncbi:MAG: RagB/SusD family nutrient uptake outer membrane protein, partial [Bacteroidales bacterium]|nr:RagB/SusD family nutrient uptake outer membrane protein [Bacteroidales bacterium]